MILPGWMHSGDDSFIARRWLTQYSFPHFGENHLRSCMVRRDLDVPPLPPLGQLKQKKLNEHIFDQHWRHGIHQNVIWIGHGRPSNLSKQNSASRMARLPRRPAV